MESDTQPRSDSVSDTCATGKDEQQSNSTKHQPKQSPMRMHILDAMQRRGTLEASSGKAVSNRHRQQSSDAMSHDGSSNSTTSDAGATAFADDTEREAMVKTIQNEMRRSRASDSQVLQCLRSLKSVCDEGLRALANGQAACISLRDGRMYNDIHPVQGSESFLYRAGWCVRVAQFERQWVHEGRTALLRTAQHVLQKTLDEMHMHNESEEARKRREQQRERERREEIKAKIKDDKKMRRMQSSHNAAASPPQ